MRDADDIREDVDRGLQIAAMLTKLKEALRALETRLKMDALDRPDEHEPLADQEREGRQFLAIGTELVLPIVMTADKLVQTFGEGSKVGQRIVAAADGHLADFYTRSITHGIAFEDGKAFLAAAVAILGEKAPAFIAACVAVDKDGIGKSDIRVEWQQAAARAKLAEASA